MRAVAEPIRVRALATAEEAREQAAGRPFCLLAFKFFDSLLRLLQRVFLHHDGLCHKVRRARLLCDTLLDEGFRARILVPGLALDLTEARKQSFNDLTVLIIHRHDAPCCMQFNLPAGQ